MVFNLYIRYNILISIYNLYIVWYNEHNLLAILTCEELFDLMHNTHLRIIFGNL